MANPGERAKPRGASLAPERLEVARRELGRTDVRAPTAWSLVLALAATILALPIYDNLFAPADGRAGLQSARGDLALAVRRGLADVWTSPFAVNRALRDEMSGFGDAVAEHSVARALSPQTQALLFDLGAGNESIYVGDDDWLFHREAVDYLLGPPFWVGDGEVERRRETADPAHVILDLQRQLSEFGIGLILLPTPVKASIHPEPLAGARSPEGVLRNRAFAAFREHLVGRGVMVIDVAPLLRARARAGHPMYLRADTHWRPEAVVMVADEVARVLEPHLSKAPDGAASYRRAAARYVRAPDLGRLLKLPPNRRAVHQPPEAVDLDTVFIGDQPWTPSRDADILLIGDSFTEIYSNYMAAGPRAGLAEQLSYRLRRPIDRAVRSAQVFDRLPGKRWLIWQLSERRLAFDPWQVRGIGSAPAGPAATESTIADRGGSVTGTIVAVTALPSSGAATSGDAITSIHVADVRGLGAAREILIYTWAIRDGERTAVAAVAGGDRLTFTVTPWGEVAERLGSHQRFEPAAAAVRRLDAYWVESLQPPGAVPRR